MHGHRPAFPRAVAAFRRPAGAVDPVLSFPKNVDPLLRFIARLARFAIRRGRQGSLFPSAGPVAGADRCQGGSLAARWRAPALATLFSHARIVFRKVPRPPPNRDPPKPLSPLPPGLGRVASSAAASRWPAGNLYLIDTDAGYNEGAAWGHKVCARWHVRQVEPRCLRGIWTGRPRRPALPAAGISWVAQQPGIDGGRLGGWIWVPCLGRVWSVSSLALRGMETSVW